MSKAETSLMGFSTCFFPTDFLHTWAWGTIGTSGFINKQTTKTKISSTLTEWNPQFVAMLKSHEHLNQSKNKHKKSQESGAYKGLKALPCVAFVN